MKLDISKEWCESKGEEGPCEVRPGEALRPSEPTVVWICGKVKSATIDSDWEFAGVFMTKEEAIKACHTKFYFIGPAVMGEQVPVESCTWEGAYYPLAEERPEPTMKNTPPEIQISGHVKCHNCGEYHWMHGPCTGPKLEPIDLPPTTMSIESLKELNDAVSEILSRVARECVTGADTGTINLATSFTQEED